MSENNNFAFTVLSIVAWVIFVGLCIEAGALIVNFIFCLYNPEFVQNLYQKMDLSEMYNRSKWAFYSMYTFILVISILKAYLFYIVIILINKLDLTKPFNSFVSEQILLVNQANALPSIGNGRLHGQMPKRARWWRGRDG